MFYTLLGLPVAWYADRRRRVPIVALALLIWSGFTCLYAGARSFTMLFVCRMRVGVGEAGSVAPSYSIVSDTFPAHQLLAAASVCTRDGGAVYH
jgi:MFS family permease